MNFLTTCPSLSDLLNLKATTFLFYALSAYLAFTIISFTVSTIKSSIIQSKYSSLALKKRSERDSQIKSLIIPPLNLPAPLVSKILNFDVVALLDMLKKGEVTSEQILIAYAQRAFTIGLDLRLITEIDFNEALIQARKCDKLRKENPSACKGILFGLPMSIKDCFYLKGTGATGGMASRLNNISKEDGLLVKILKEEGAIPFVKSNIPQAMMTCDTNNFIWGLAQNPWDKNRSVGGSSGGEAALIAARCSPLGIGNDVGGSIRIPAIYCGCVGFKPMAERMSGVGGLEVAPTLSCIPNMPVATGPITKTARDASLLMKALLNGEYHKKTRLSEKDAYHCRKEWNEDLVNHKPKGMKIGYFRSLDIYPTSPANERAVVEAAEALKKRGYEVVEVEFPNLEEIVLIYLEIIAAEGDTGFLRDGLQGEKSIPEYMLMKLAALPPNWARNGLGALARLLGEVRSAKLVEVARKLNAYEFIHLAAKQTKVRKEFFRVWEEKGLDGILLPSFAFPALKRGYTKDLSLGACYTFLLNVLNLPSGAVPVTVVKKGEDCYPKKGKYPRDMMHKKTEETMEGSEGMPIAVQIATLPWEDEKCVGIMIQLEEEIQFMKKHPFPEL